MNGFIQNRRRRRFCRHRIPHRGQIAEAIAPHSLSGREAHKCLRCAAIFFPVFLVLRTDPFEFDWQACVPVACALRLFKAGKVRHQIAVRRRAGQGNNCAHGELVGALFEPPREFDDVVAQRQFVARFRVQIVGEPLVDEDFIVAQVGGHGRRAHRRDHRIGHRTVSDAQFVDEVSQNSGRMGPDLKRGAGSRRVEKDAARAQFERTDVG